MPARQAAVISSTVEANHSARPSQTSTPPKEPATSAGRRMLSEVRKNTEEFSDFAKSNVDNLILQLTSKYAEIAHELARCKQIIKANEELQGSVIKPLQQENSALKAELDTLRAAMPSLGATSKSLTLEYPGQYESEHFGSSLSQRSDKALGVCTMHSEAYQPNITLSSDKLRMVVFLDLSPECDDECALLYLLTECNNSHTEAVVELIVPDSLIRYAWFQHLFKGKLDSKVWQLSEDGSSFRAGTVLVNIYLLPSPRQSMVEEDMRKKLGDKYSAVEAIYHEALMLIPRDAMEVLGGPLAIILMAAPVPDLMPEFFSRFTTTQATYVVGTPGGVNCPAPSWSSTLNALQLLGPVVYLSPQFTREVRFPKNYVQENPHWTWFMKKTIFDSALTVMARRPEIPAKFGNWGLILRLNSANAKACSTWYEEVMGAPLDMENTFFGRFKAMVSAYVDRMSGSDRAIGNVVSELSYLGVNMDMSLTHEGEPQSAEDKATLRDLYRKELFRVVYTCVATTETLLFSHQSNFKYIGERGLPTLLPRCGYSDPMENLAKIFGTEDAIEILRALPLKGLTPAYDMVGAICALKHVNHFGSDLEDPNFVEMKVAPPNLSSDLLQGAPQVNRIFVVNEQLPEVVENLIGMLVKNVSSDPLVLIDEHWASLKAEVAVMAPKPTKTHNERSFASQGRTQTHYRGADFFHSYEFASTVQLVGLQNATTAFCNAFMVHPTSNREIIWTIVSFFFIIYDCIMVPLSVFGFEEIKPVMYLLTLWWTFDVPHNFLVGYYHNGVVDLRPRSVARHYLLSWFVLDTTIVGVDWFILLFHLESDFIFMFKMLRVLRLFRLQSVSKLERFYNQLLESCPRRDLLGMSVKICQMMASIFFANHVVACVWYYVATFSDSRNWVQTAGLTEASIPYLYFSALHWAFAHLMLGEMDIIPSSELERIYSVGVLMMGLVVFSSFVSSITEFMARIATEQAEHSRKDQEVRKYMEDHNVSAGLAMQVDRFRKHSEKTAVMEVLSMQDVDGLSELPELLATRLSREVFHPSLITHGFFASLTDLSSPLVSSLISAVMAEEVRAPRQECFKKGDPTDTVYIIARGGYSYVKEGMSIEEQAQYQWVSEHALWLGNWHRRGILTSRTIMVLHALHIPKFKLFAVEELHCVGALACHFAELVAHAKENFAELHDLQVDLLGRMVLADQATNMVRGEDKVVQDAFLEEA